MALDLILTNPTRDERVRVWSGSHPLWGGALSLDGYLEREVRQLDIPLARDGGLTQWILTDASIPAGQPRPILSSCETLKKTALVRSPDGTTRQVTAHGVASVFTDPQYRRKGYAKAMLAKLADTLSRTNQDQPDQALFSVLYSDIGKEFYALNGWEPYTSTHIVFPADASATDATSHKQLKPIGADGLPSLVAVDEQLLRKELSRPSARGAANRVALLPNLDQMLWHTAREGFVSEQLLSRRPTTHGAVYSTPAGPRVWAIWIRSYGGAVDQREKNILYILRLVVEEGVSPGDLAPALEAILGAARREAADWSCGTVQIWNPEPAVKEIAQGLGGEFVVRETSSICALNWFGEGSGGDAIDWVLNEKYAWC